MGVFDTLIDGEKSVQIKMFGDSFCTYKVGDKLPCDGSFIIVLPDYEDARFVFVKDGIFIGLTDCPPIIVDKWGNHLVSYDAFKNPHEELIRTLSETAKEEDEK